MAPGNVQGLLHLALRGSPCRASSSELRVQLANDDACYPDATVWCSPAPRADEPREHPRRVLGALVGRGFIADDFDAPLDAAFLVTPIAWAPPSGRARVPVAPPTERGRERS